MTGPKTIRLAVLALVALVLSAGSLLSVYANLAVQARTSAGQGGWFPPRFALDEAARTMLMKGESASSQYPRICADAVASLKREPLNAAALWAACADGKTKLDRLALAERVSRREAGVQFELMAIAETRGDLKGGLTRLDRMLSVYPELQPNVLPGVAAALPRSDLRDALLPFRAREWFVALVSEAINTTPESEALLDLVGRSAVLETFPDARLRPRLLARFVSEGRADLPRALLARVGDRVKADLTAFSPAANNTQPDWQPLSWTLHSNESVAASLARDGAISIALQTERIGVLLDRVTLLNAGIYGLSFSAMSSNGDVDLVLKLACLSAGDNAREVFSYMFKASEFSKLHEVRVPIPAECGLQRWQFSRRPGEIATPVDVQLASIALRPLGK